MGHAAKRAGTRRDGGRNRLLLRPGEIVPFQRMEREETWRVLRGDPVEIHLIHADGSYEKRVLDAGGRLRIAAGSLRAARLVAQGRSAEILRRVARGPGSKEPEIPLASRILREHPLHETILRGLTR